MNPNSPPHIVLASSSPRRRALLSALGLEFEVCVSGIEEVFEGTPPEMVIRNAVAKRDDVVSRLREPSLVIAADTLVFLDEHVLGKPSDTADARRMLRILSGRAHEVLTGLAVTDTRAGVSAEGFETTRVRFRELSEHEIERFVEAVNPLDRAGAYTVDGPGSLIVAAYDGCYQNVLGLPIVRLDRLMREIGYSLFDLMDGRKAVFL